MEHVLVSSIEKALGWSGPKGLGAQFVRGALPDAELCARILNPNRLLDIIMRRSLSNPQLRVFQDGGEIHPARFLDEGTSRRGQAVRMANMPRLASLMEDGCTIVLDGVDAFDPTMEVACRALGWWSREHARVNTYLTTGATDGFPLHWDDHEVLVVQLAGEKSWEVRGQSRVAPMHRDAERNNTPPDEIIWQGTLKAGDVMNIPRGCWHRATRADQGDGFSLHATFGFSKQTAVDWLTWAGDQARRDGLFRADLNRWGTRDVRQQESDTLKGAAMSLIEGYPVEDFLAERERLRRVWRHVKTKSIFGTPDAVACITEFPPQFEQRSGRVLVTGAGKQIAFAEEALPALRLLLSGAPVDLTEVESATGVEVEGLAAVLIEEELCAELTAELRSGYTDLVMSGISSKELSLAGSVA
ncbi:cupin [Lentzea tibetensis]|uniref:Cupin n=1 Tax=Lentzea tibetensis TaxID=2591470 RepID=A0A563EKJ5_9PSEU|nr:cupin domain-containing protein [Lentzea tibetensis]TWP47401.1 cupin [Lentzea tibetensis]